ncbi:hypothetical protein [Kitasatospora cheerisanensis]|uniref:Uncharacterized protein n=1 Tax=Kitasatospora cheerisanensis KCTC 2395 TaxID=1348663 RepID=A0A066YT37_9ACTN|nr:hypothetical protein [Kitasatospora cheerisanensis]KDN81236.1 hypothetical protein KCH_70470 [Kitasatospora cheerisanensis KCTC 2395]
MAASAVPEPAVPRSAVPDPAVPDPAVPRPVVPEDAARTGAAGRVLRGLAALHTVAVYGQPVFAGVYLSGAYDGLGWHLAGANAVTSLGYLQLIAAVVLWFRSRLGWPLVGTALVVIAETVQYFAGLDGALWLHLPLGVATIVGLTVLTLGLLRVPLPGRGPAVRGE